MFFDEIGIKYEYEKEGYDLGALGWYLPDFWLPEFCMWVEVKPFIEIHDGKFYRFNDEAHEKASGLRDVTGNPVLVVRGEPANMLWREFYSHFVVNCGDGDCEGDAVFAKGDNGAFLCVFNLGSPEPEYHDEMSFGTWDKPASSKIKLLAKCRGEFGSVMDDWISNNVMCVFDDNKNSAVLDAALKARQARFEHGEKG